MHFTFDRPNKLVTVPDTETEVSVQDLYDQCRDYEDLPESMSFVELVDAEGKTDLGGSEFIVVTLFMINGWRVKFDDRAGPGDTTVRVYGGNIVGRVGDKASAAQHPIAPSNYTFPIIYQATTGLIVTPAASTTEANAALAVKLLHNRQELVDTGTDIRLRTYDDDGTTTLEENIVTDPTDGKPALLGITKRGVPQ